jgi:hypothetical protein
MKWEKHVRDNADLLLTDLVSRKTPLNEQIKVRFLRLTPIADG